jgi:hypothetical protein
MFILRLPAPRCVFNCKASKRVGGTGPRQCIRGSYGVHVVGLELSCASGVVLHTCSNIVAASTAD